MKEAQITAEENYSKEVGVGRFILEWAFISIVGISFYTCLLIIIKIVIDIFFYILFERDLNIINYVLNETFYADWDEPLFIIFMISDGFDLRWFPKKEDFLHSLKNICTKRNIPFYESGLTYFSRIWLRIGFGL